MLRRLSEQDYYQVLDVDYRATADEIRKAYESAREIYSVSSLVCSSILTAQERRRIFRHITEAYHTLAAEESRRQYDQTLAAEKPSLEEILSSGPASSGGEGDESPDSAPSRSFPRLVKDSAPSRKTVEKSKVVLGLKEEATGKFLREARESAGIDLRSIAEETKIGITVLRFIEQERLDQLPAPVYLRNFVSQFARCLGLDEEKVARSYLARIRRLQPREH